MAGGVGRPLVATSGHNMAYQQLLWPGPVRGNWEDIGKVLGGLVGLCLHLALLPGPAGHKPPLQVHRALVGKCVEALSESNLTSFYSSLANIY